MRVLVTGASGFIGSRLCERLVEEGYQVYGLYRWCSAGRCPPDGVHPVYGDLCDPHSLLEAVREARPDVVFHLAAVTPVGHSFRLPRLYAEVNYGGTVNLVECFARVAENPLLFCYASTSEVYGDQDAFPIREDAPPRPNTPYAVSKYAAELYLRFYARSRWHLPLVVARPFNTYGRANVGQRFYVVEKILTSMLLGDERLLLGRPDASRDLMFREDHVSAYLSILEAVEDGRDVYGRVYNFCTGTCVTVRQLVELCRDAVARVTGEEWEGSVVWNAYHRPVDIVKLHGSYGRAEEELGWRPRYGLAEGLERAAEEWAERLGVK